MFGDPDHTEIVNVASLNQQAGITAGKVKLFPGSDGKLYPRVVEKRAVHHEPPEPEPGRPTLDLLEHEPLWPDRHPALYRHLPWPVRRSIITHYLKESDA